MATRSRSQTTRERYYFDGGLSETILGAACPIDFGFEKSLGIERSQVGPYYNIDPPAIVQSRGFFKAKIDRSGRAEYSQIALIDGEYHHLLNVMRGKVGDSIILVDGRGSMAEGKVLALEKKRGIIEVISVKKQKPEPSFALIQALPRINRLDFIVEKATELGVGVIYLFPGDTSERKLLTPQQLERLQNITIAAMKQCERLYLPKIIVLPAMLKWKNEEILPQVPLFFGDLNPEAKPFLIALQSHFNSSFEGAAFCTGPESGFSTNEELLLKNMHAIGVNLHTNVLRTDTASLAAMALMAQFSLKS